MNRPLRNAGLLMLQFQSFFNAVFRYTCLFHNKFLLKNSISPFVSYKKNLKHDRQKTICQFKWPPINSKLHKRMNQILKKGIGNKFYFPPSPPFGSTVKDPVYFELFSESCQAHHHLEHFTSPNLCGDNFYTKSTWFVYLFGRGLPELFF